MIDIDGPHARASRVLRLAAFVLPLLLAAACYAPALRAYFAQDDFAFVAIARLLHEPWLLFVHDHFPGSMYFRPLGVLLWWIVCAFAADTAWPQYAVNLVLHCACVAALYTLLQRLRAQTVLSGCFAAIYAVHPLAIGTGLWLSDRFDLLTTLFGLLAFNAALAYVAQQRAATFIALLVYLLLGFLSKELGIVAAAATFVLIAFAPRTMMKSAARLRALGAIALLTAAWLLYRHAVLTPIGDGAAHLPALDVFMRGTLRWLHVGAVYLAGDPRVPRYASILLAISAVLWIAAMLVSFRRASAHVSRIYITLGLLTLTLLPGLVQAPVAITHLGVPEAGAFWFQFIVSVRFFHLALAGFLCLLALAIDDDAKPVRNLVLCATALALVALAPVSHRIAHDYASGTRPQIAALQAAESALDNISVPTSNCQIYFLRTDALWGFSGYSDAIAKGLSRDPQRLAHCMVSTERPPWAYFLRAGSVDAQAVHPLHPLIFGDKPLPWIRLGDVEEAYLRMDADIAAAIPSQALFLDYQNGRFVDVSAAVRSGERKVDFVTE